jgi:lysyl-tRNA synthetase class 1
MFWADSTTEDIIKGRKKTNYVVTDWKTPSGKIHVGALRGVIIHDVISRALIEKNKKVKYIYGFDNFDPMDDLPAGIDPSYRKYLGMPLCEIPAPERALPRLGGRAKAGNSFDHFYADEFKKVYQDLGVESEIVWMSEYYKHGKMDDSIKMVLENAKKIREIYLKVSGSKKGKNWYPFQVVCPSCKKIGTTEVDDFKDNKVHFNCKKDLVSWAQGCGKEGWISPYKGAGKIPYKVEIAAKWNLFGTDFEAAGKDHYTKGGTFDVAKEIAREVFKIKPATGFGYEWFLVAGKKMSTSKGIGFSAEEISKIMPSEILRFLMVRTRPKRTIDFEPYGESIPALFNDFDIALLEYIKDPKSDAGRIFNFSMINKERKLSQYNLKFSKIAYMLQMPRADLTKYAEQEKGTKLTNVEQAEINLRENYAKGWLKDYAPENYKFEIKSKMPKEANKLSNLQKEFLSKILEKYKEKKWAGEDLHHEIHKIRKELSINPREAFGAIYLIFIGKDSGPQAGWFLTSLDKDLVEDRLKESIK